LWRCGECYHRCFSGKIGGGRKPISQEGSWLESKKIRKLSKRRKVASLKSEKGGKGQFGGEKSNGGGDRKVKNERKMMPCERESVEIKH